MMRLSLRNAVTQQASLRRSTARIAAAVIAATVAATALAGCAQAVALEPADNAIDVGCAEIVVRLPDTVAELEIRETNAQGTGAWGTPTAVILRCGVAEPSPTSTLPCVLVDDVYWLRDDANAPSYVFTTYGRSPATEVIVNREAVSPGVALYDLVNAVSFSTETSACTEIEDSLG
ncbi:MAG: DUF3515 family protein [Microbacteriaceae bacterium]